MTASFTKVFPSIAVRHRRLLNRFGGHYAVVGTGDQDPVVAQDSPITVIVLSESHSGMPFMVH